MKTDVNQRAFLTQTDHRVL